MENNIFKKTGELKNDFNPAKEVKANQDSKIPGLKHFRNAVAGAMALAASFAVAPKAADTLENLSHKLGGHTEQEGKYSALDRRINNILAGIRNGANINSDQAALDYFVTRKALCEEAKFQLGTVRTLDRSNNSGPEVKDQLASAKESLRATLDNLNIHVDENLNVLHLKK